MSSSALAAGLRQLRGKLAAQQKRDDSDEQLLHAFTASHDDNAFAVLVRRHGPMVLHVCRRVLGHEQDAEDAFQATFLVLARNAESLRNKASLASFLHGTAYRTALKAKQTVARRRKHEGALGALTQPRSPSDPADELRWREVRTFLDEEIGQLPEIHRIVFVLFYLEDINQQEIARRLGLKAATVAKRLTVARRRLGESLRRRGVELTALLSATALAIPSVSAMPAGLMASTIKAASAAAAGEGLTGVVSASVADLAQSAMTAAIAGKAKLVAAVLLLVATSGSLVGLFGRASEPLATTTELPAAKAEDKPLAASPKRDTPKSVEIHGRVVDPDGKPVRGAKLFAMHRTTAVSAFRTDALGITDAEGRFRVLVRRPDSDGQTYLLGHAAGFGVDWVDLSADKRLADVTLRLVKDVPIAGQVVNTESRPVAGVSVSITGIYVPPNDKLDDYLKGGLRRFQDKLNFETPRQLLHVRFDAISGKVTTDKDGRFRIRGTGRERIVLVTISGGGVLHSTHQIITRPGFDAKPYNELVKEEFAGQAFPLLLASPCFLHPPVLKVIADAGKTIEGTIKDADSGKPIPGCRVIGRMELGEVIDDDEVISGPRGEYRLENLSKNATLLVGPPKGSAYLFREVQAANVDRLARMKLDIELAKGAIITGRVVDKQSGKGVKCSIIRYVPMAANKFFRAKPGFDTYRNYFEEGTDKDGRFRLVTIPGKVLILALTEQVKLNGQDLSVYRGAVPDPDHKDFFIPANIPGTEGWVVGTAEGDGAVYPAPGVHNAVKVVDAKEDGETRAELFVDRGATVRIAVQDANGKPLAGTWAAGLTDHWPIAYKLPEATAIVYALNPDRPRRMAFYHPPTKLGGTALVRGDEEKPIVVKLAPGGKVVGRLLNGDGKPLEDVEVLIDAQTVSGHELYRFAMPTGKPVHTDKNGRFRIEGVVPDLKFTLRMRKGRAALIGVPRIGVKRIRAGASLDLGDVRVIPGS